MPHAQLALCDFGSRIISLNSEMSKFVHHKTDFFGLENSTLAHELGHLRLHREEFAETAAANYYRGASSDKENRHFQKEYEADLYLAVFLVPKNQVLETREGKSIH